MPFTGCCVGYEFRLLAILEVLNVALLRLAVGLREGGVGGRIEQFLDDASGP